MSLTLKVAKVGLPLLFLLGVGGTHVLGTRNGLFDLMKETAQSGTFITSGKSLRTEYSGYKPVDEFIVMFIAFFMPLLDGDHPSITLQGMHFGGQLASYWVLIVVESFRSGNKA